MHRGSRASRKNKDKLDKIRWFYGLRSREELQEKIQSIKKNILACSNAEAIEILWRSLKRGHS